MSQRALATAAGVPQATVGRIEAGLVNPRVDTLARLLTVTGHELALVPVLGVGIDRTLIRDRLAMKPAERIRLAMDEVRAMPQFRPRREHR